MSRRINGKPGRRFLWMAYDSGGCNTMPTCQEVMANDFGHALQKIAAQLPDPDRQIDKISIWETIPYEPVKAEPDKEPRPQN